MKFTSITIAACALQVRTSQACDGVWPVSHLFSPSQACDSYLVTSPTATHSGNAKNKGKHLGNQRDLEEVGAGDEHVVVGTVGIDPDTNEPFTFFATNVTKAAIFNLGFTKSEECSDEAHDNAMIVKVSEERLISTDTPGTRGWNGQSVSQLDDGELSTVLALADVITGADSNYTLVSYFYDHEKNLLACAHLKKHDNDTAAMYNELFKSLQEQEEVAAAAAAENVDAAAGVDDAAVKDTSSGSKNGLFMFASAIAAAGIAAVMLSDVLAL